MLENSGEISMMGLFMVTAGLATTYAITTFGPKLSLQNKIKATKSKMKELRKTNAVYIPSKLMR
ncbi:MAG: hypothetical protein ACJ72V_02275 [Nitrososphaeraceae archaeon]